MSVCPSWLELAQVESGSGSDLARKHVEACPRCTGIVADIAGTRKELLGGDPHQASAIAARTLMRAAGERRVLTRRRWRQSLTAMAAPAAGLILIGFALFSVRSIGDFSAFSERPAATAPTTRAKGGLILQAFCKRGEEVFQVEGGEKFLAGDRLRFSYTTAEPGYLTVFGVDGKGAVSAYYPENHLEGLAVPAGIQQALPGSVELDRYRGWERVFAVWSPRPLDPAAIESSVASGLRAAGWDIPRLERLSLGAAAEQTSFLLERP